MMELQKPSGGTPMLVNQLLSMKSTSGKPGIEAQTILTIRPDATLGDAAKMLSEKRIGAVVVSDDGKKPQGILSERDIVRQLGAHGPDILSTPISEVMTREVQTCVLGDDALVILERMTKGRFRHLPVVDENGDMLGVVSIGDAVSGRLKELAAEKEALTGMIMGA
jgi:CBS domain-containing protein